MLRNTTTLVLAVDCRLLQWSDIVQQGLQRRVVQCEKLVTIIWRLYSEFAMANLKLSISNDDQSHRTDAGLVDLFDVE